MTTIGVIGAMQVEIDKLIMKYDLKKDAVKDIYVNEFNDRRIVVAMSGVGKVNSAAMTQYIIDKYDVDAIINSGVAGGISNKLNIMDIVISDYVTYHDFLPTRIMESYVPDMGKIKSNTTLVNISKKVVEDMNLDNYHYAPICSGDIFVTDEEIKNDILLRTGAVCVDMESASIAHTCSMNNIPFISIRTISDMADGGEYLEDIAAYKSSEFVSKLVYEIFDYLDKEKVEDSKVYLHVPEYEEIDYYSNLLKDPKTMNYNAGYDLNLEGYDKETGCILSFDSEKWYKKQMNDKNRYFAYIVRKEDNKPVGYVNFHFDNEYLTHGCGIVIENKYREKGYAKEALKLLLDKAFNEYNIKSLINNIPYNRSNSLKLFTKAGFKDMKKDYYMKKFDINERIIMIELTKDEYNEFYNKIILSIIPYSLASLLERYLSLSVSFSICFMELLVKDANISFSIFFLFKILFACISISVA